MTDAGMPGWRSERPLLRVDAPLRPHLRRLRRAAPFRGAGGHRIRVTVRRVYFHPAVGMDRFSRWMVEAKCRCGLDVWDSVMVAHARSPGLSFRRVLRGVRDWIGGMGCRERAAVATVSEVLGS